MAGSNDALGMIETWGYPALVAAADAAAKAADVKIVSYQGADAGIVTIYMMGDVASVQAAVAVGEQAAQRVGKLLGSHVIARPDACVPLLIGEAFQRFREDRVTRKPESVPIPPLLPEALEQKSVAELRKLARSLNGLGLSGQEISNARKGVLIDHLRAWLAKRGDGSS